MKILSADLKHVSQNLKSWISYDLNIQSAELRIVGRAPSASAGVSTYDLGLTLVDNEGIDVVTVTIGLQEENISSSSPTTSFGELTAGIDYYFTVENGHGHPFSVSDTEHCTSNVIGTNNPMTIPSSYTINISGTGTPSFKINVQS
jgi:hypothetical protein